VKKFLVFWIVFSFVIALLHALGVPGIVGADDYVWAG
jgi:hypothetical protein